MDNWRKVHSKKK